MTGIQNPPRVVASSSLLSAASIPGLDLQATSIDTTEVSAARANARKYTDIDGLRRLQANQTGQATDQVIGWRYKPSTGLIPELNQAAYGTINGPNDRIEDSMPGGAKWYWDLARAEKDITTAACANANKCSQLKYLGKFQDVCGYCKSSGAMIPVEKLASGKLSARFMKDDALNCPPEDIVTSSYGVCPPATEGFSSREEGFSLMDDIDNNCSLPLTRDCLLNIARARGCRDDATLITSLKASSGSTYDQVLKATPSFKAYQTAAISPLTPAMLRSGDVRSMSVALDDFDALVTNARQPPTSKLGASARDLCFTQGAYDTYNFCAELKPTTRITEDYISCIQNDWLTRGGTTGGTAYPKAKGGSINWSTKTYQDYLSFIDTLLNNVRNGDKATNAAAIVMLTGTQSDVQVELVRDENTRGAETVWFHLGDTASTTPTPTILRCDLKLSKDGAVIPRFRNTNELSTNYRVPMANIGFTSAFEFRPDVAKNIILSVASQDGFMVGVNQNPFEKLQSGDWGSWRYQQSAAWYQSYQISLKTTTPTPPPAAQNKNRNNIVLKYFKGSANAYFWFVWGERLASGGIKQWNDQVESAGERADMYLTQEPLAPWLNYEICKRPNTADVARTEYGFLERRWNGPAGITRGGKSIPSFDVITQGLSITNPYEKSRGYASFTQKSSWKMHARLGFNAVRTITLMVNPTSNLANARTANILLWYSRGVGNAIFIKNINGNYTLAVYTHNKGWSSLPVVTNEWNYIVLQVIGDEGGVRDFNVNAATVSSLKTEAARVAFVASLTAKQNSTGNYIIESAGKDPNLSAPLRLGAVLTSQNPDILIPEQQDGFEGQISFLHGFREYINTTKVLQKDLSGTWETRWARGNE